jgi:hypothetical protein
MNTSNQSFDPRLARLANARKLTISDKFDAAATYGKLNKLFTEMNRVELAVARHQEFQSVADAARKTYNDFYLAEIWNSKNPIIVANNNA